MVVNYVHDSATSHRVTWVKCLAQGYSGRGRGRCGARKQTKPACSNSWDATSQKIFRCISHLVTFLQKNCFTAHSCKWYYEGWCFNTPHCLATSGSLWQPGKIPGGLVRKEKNEPDTVPAFSSCGWRRTSIFISCCLALYIATLNYLHGAPVMER